MRAGFPVSVWPRLPVILSILLFSLSASFAGVLKVPTAGISPKNPRAGERVTLTYKIYDAFSISSSKPRMPDSIQAGGITFQLVDATADRALGAHYFRATYTARATRPGIFKVPSVRLRAGGESIKTRPLTFRVGGKAEVEEEKPPFDPSKVPATSRVEQLPASRLQPAPRPAAATAHAHKLLGVTGRPEPFKLPSWAFPRPLLRSRWELRPINNELDLVAAGRRSSNCAALMAESCRNGGKVIAELCRSASAGTKLPTVNGLEVGGMAEIVHFGGRWHLNQCRGFANGVPVSSARSAVLRFVNELNNGTEG